MAAQYKFSLNKDDTVTLGLARNEKEETLNIPLDELLPWVMELDNFLGKLGINSLTRKKHPDTDGDSYMEQQKRLHKSAYQPWTPEADAELTTMHNNGDFDKNAAAEHFGRNPGAIQSRLKKLGLLAPKNNDQGVAPR